MGKCSNCGFDPEYDSLAAEGAPCGVDGCYSLTCCQKTWKEHCKRVHPDYYYHKLASKWERTTFWIGRLIKIRIKVTIVRLK